MYNNEYILCKIFLTHMFLFCQIGRMLNVGVWQQMQTCKPELQILVENAKEIAVSSRETSTCIKYSLYFDKWKTWCRKHLEGESLPGSPIGVGLFLSELAKSVTSASTINAHFYAIKWAHNLCGLDVLENIQFKCWFLND